MSIDACKLNAASSSSILLKKISRKPSTTKAAAANNTSPCNNSRKDNIITNKKGRSSSFSKLQSVGLSLVASVSKRRNPPTKELNKYASTTSLPSNPPSSTNKKPPPPPPQTLTPSISARPFSQFFFPIKEEEDDDMITATVPVAAKKTSATINKNERELLLPSPPQQKQQQQIQQVKKNKQQQRTSCYALSNKPTPRQNQQQTTRQKRHSIALVDFYSNNSSGSDETTNSNSSSRSSSLKTIKNQPIVDNVIIASPTSDITFFTSSSLATLHNKKSLTRSPSTNSRLSGGVARARTVLGLDSLKSTEMRAIHVWRDTISQLSTEEELSADEDEEDEGIMLERDENELYEILSHPALMPEHNNPLELQRFVRHSSTKHIQKQPTTKDTAMMKFILNELIETEKSYNQLLLLIRNRYMYPMIAASQSKDPLVKSSDIPILFNHLPELVQLSDKLLNQLQQDKNIGQVFRSIESELVVFLKYAMHYRSNIKTIKRACSNVLFVKIDQENLARRDTNRLGMSDYFIAPIQRIPRYCLLIKDLQKYTDPMNTLYIELDFALKVLTGLAVAMDHVQQQNRKATTLTYSPSSNQLSPISRTSVRTL